MTAILASLILQWQICYSTTILGTSIFKITTKVYLYLINGHISMASEFRLSALCTLTFNWSFLLLNLHKYPVTSNIRWLEEALSILKAKVMDEPTKGLPNMSCSVVDLFGAWANCRTPHPFRASTMFEVSMEICQTNIRGETGLGPTDVTISNVMFCCIVAFWLVYQWSGWYNRPLVMILLFLYYFFLVANDCS